MGEHIGIDTANGRIGGWLALPEGKPRGGLVVIQEIFGVNAHIRSVADRFAGFGYAALAPALFDPVEADVELDYTPTGIARGRDLVAAVGFDRALDGVSAAAQVLRELMGTMGSSRGADPDGESPHKSGGRVAVVGYCWGGSLAFLAATRLALPAISYYGARTVPFANERAQAALLFHFGERDASIPAADIAKIVAAQPQAEVHVWPAGHGFNCDQRADYAAESAANALTVTLGFLERELG